MEVKQLFGDIAELKGQILAESQNLQPEFQFCFGFKGEIDRFMDKWGKNKLIVPALAVATLGSILFMFADNMAFVIVAGIILMSGYMVLTALFGAKIRDYTPVGKAGLFQGIRMIFIVMIPMVTGPYIGQALSYIDPMTYINEYGEQVLQPNKFIFFGAAIIMGLCFIPTVYLIEKENRKHEHK